MGKGDKSAKKEKKAEEENVGEAQRNGDFFIKPEKVTWHLILACRPCCLWHAVMAATNPGSFFAPGRAKA